MSPGVRAIARCGCGTDCACAIAGGCGVVVSGNGGPLSPYTVAVDLSEDSGNGLECREDGLYAGGGEGGGLSAVTTADSSCVDFSGDGTAGSPLTATPVVDSSPLNLLECGSDGLLARSRVTAFATFVDGGSPATVLPAAAQGAASTVPVNYGTALASSNFDVEPSGTLARPYTHAVVQAGQAGLHWIQAARPGWVAGPAVGEGIIRLTLMVNNDPVASKADTLSISAAQAYNTPELLAQVMWPLSEGDVVWVQAQVEAYDAGFAGATLAGGAYGFANSFLHIYRIGALA